jgi:hypothetical protein
VINVAFAVGITCLAAAVITFAAAAIIVGTGDLQALRHAVSLVREHAKAYIVGGVAIPAVTGLVSYQYAKREFTFKSNQITQLSTKSIT